MLLASIVAGWHAGVIAATAEEEALLSLYGSEEIVSIATGQTQPISRAPAVATVITRDDIHEIGAVQLAQVLETVPGLHVSASSIGYNPIYTMRGIYTQNNSAMLLLVNGIPMTQSFFGNQGQVWAGMPVEDIERIEVIRGPGSALYGADAYAGVINVITRTAADIGGVEAGVRGGSYDTRNAWASYGDASGGWEKKFYVEYYTTKGHDGVVGADAQTSFDQLLGTSASLAPGEVNTERDQLDARLELGKGPWLLRTMYQDRRGGVGVGIAEALDPEGQGEGYRWLTDLTYHKEVAQHWDLQATASYYDVANESSLHLFPAGADFTALGGGPFPDGVYAEPDVYERHTRLEVSAFYTGFSQHSMRFGTGVHHADMYKTTERKNYEQNPFGIPVPLGGIDDVTDTNPFIRPHDRTISFLYLQDEWRFAPDWSLTAGVRYDNYSDFGDTINPRLALVWNTSLNLTTKFLYGRAFRPPTFSELYNENNPAVLGNPDLKPQTIDTYELAFDARPREDVRTSLNLFYYSMQDAIRFEPDPPPATSSTAQNSGEQEGYGGELELSWKAARTLEVVGNYAYQHSEDKGTEADPGFAPAHQLYARLNWTPVSSLSVHPQVSYIADRARAEGDTREAIDDYVITDLTLRYRPAQLRGLELAISGRNIFDEDAREPSSSSGLIPDDLPLPGRHYYAELRYAW
ncbi:MAG: hypothetical protein AMJ69_10365 [Gammaproteobacteria bacterium SG8_47]|nr:MAG: hypothetical protein AMJ69_10365 [Gammaproteobacteria bacterium SG8_47]